MRRADVVAYFADDASRAYQLVPWLPVLALLDASRRVVVVTRDPAAAEAIRAHTELPVRLAATFESLTETYAELDAAVVLYCNNSRLNVDSLLDPRMLHVHVNHGESDKQSMASNNAKAYDRVFVAGPAAVERYAATLLELDTSRLVPVGRPQLDISPTALLPASARRTVLYAPTWEGDAAYNNYTSVDVLGPAIVGGLLAVPDVRVVYKPHPKVTTSTTPSVSEAHLAVLALLTDAGLADPTAGHLAVPVGDILAVIPACGLIVTDVSSVAIDWLYLRPDGPVVLADRWGDAERLRATTALTRGADTVDAATVPGLTALVTDRLRADPLADERRALRRHYVGDLAPGESTRRFVTAVGELVELRDRLVR